MDTKELNDTLIAHAIMQIAEPMKHGLTPPLTQKKLAEIMSAAALQYSVHRRLALAALAAAQKPKS